LNNNFKKSTLKSTGFCIIADKLNYMRYLSHFRSVHRGAVFTEIRTTSVRKLTPESWGFLCPVHTPDGGLCGLLNHLSFMCEVKLVFCIVKFFFFNFFFVFLLDLH